MRERARQAGGWWRARRAWQQAVAGAVVATVLVLVAGAFALGVPTAGASGGGDEAGAGVAEAQQAGQLGAVEDCPCHTE